MKCIKLLKSTQALFLAIAMIVALIAAPLMGVSATENDSFGTVHSQPGNGKVYVYKTGSATGDDRWGQNNLFNDVTVISGKTYTFSALWFAGSNDKTQVKVGNATIVNGYYNMQNGAKYDPYTGRISYTFTADSDTVQINLENRGDTIQEKNYSFADPQIIETDSNGNAVENGDIADCDVDFCPGVWIMNINWNQTSDWTRDSYVSVGEASSFATKEKPHTQPDNGKVYVYKTGSATGDDRWGNNNLFNDVTVISGKTYTFSALWFAGSNDKTQVKVGNTMIVNGYYNMQNGAKYDPYTGRISYTFTADSDTVQINLENRGDNIQEKNYSFADPQIIETDSNGNAVENGDIAECDVDFCPGVWIMNINWNQTSDWTRDSYVSVGEASSFATKEKPHGQDEVTNGDVWVLSYAQSWNKTAVSYTADVVSGKRYTFSILWKDLGSSSTVVRINATDITDNNKGTNILEGGYNTVNGASFDPATGRLSYTFVAESANATITFDNRDYGDEYNKNYAIADPQMYEVDENGNAIPNGDTVDCDVDFCAEKWIITNHLYDVVEQDDNLTVAGGYLSDFAIRKSHAQPDGENKVYALSYRYSYDQKQVTISPFVFKGKTYTFSMLYRVYGSNTSTTRISVNGTQILNGNYNVQNGATYDPYTGRIYYTFKAADSKVEIALDNLGSENSEKYHSYDIADPQLIETDSAGNAVENGDVADCDVDFCEWRVWNWNNTYNPLDARTEVSESDFALRHQPHTQPADGVYVLSYDVDMWDAANLNKDVYVISGKSYTFTVLWKDITKTTIIYVDGNEIMNCGVLKNGATYNTMTGELKYTFTASSSNIRIQFNNLDENRKNHAYSIANPQIYESDSNGNAVKSGDVADCDVDFCEWEQEGWNGITAAKFQITVNYDWAFLQEVKLCDVNGDGSFDIRDLVAAKKSLAGTRSEALNLLSLGYSVNATEISAEDLVFIRKLLLGVSDFRTKEELSNLISQLHNSVSDDNTNRYAIGYNAAGSTRIAAGIETFAEKTGQKPSYVDYDMSSLPYINESNKEYLIAQMAKFNRDGGFVALTAHWIVPTQKLSESSNDGAVNSKHSLTAQEYAQVYTPGNDIYNNFREELAIEAGFIRKLKELGINVIFRPMHEINIKSFWWCVNSETGVTPQMTVNLYNYIYNYFTTECGLDNIIWQFNADVKADVSNLISPSNVDMLSIDCYWRDGYYNLSDTYIYLQNIGGDKAVAISEFFSYDEAAYSDLNTYLTKLTNGLTYKFAYLGIYCDLDRLSNVTLPDNVLTLSDTAQMSR